MGQFSVKISGPTGSILSGIQQRDNLINASPYYYVIILVVTLII